MSNNNKNLGKILKRQRILLSLTLRELAAESGVSTSHLARIERGERLPSGDVLKKIAEPLGFEVDELFILAGYLGSQPTTTDDQGTVHGFGQLDPYVARLLAQERAEVQRAVIGILSIMKNIAKEYQYNMEFAEYAHRKYPEVDEDTIAIADDLMKNPKVRNREDESVK